MSRKITDKNFYSNYSITNLKANLLKIAYISFFFLRGSGNVDNRVLFPGKSSCS